MPLALQSFRMLVEQLSARDRVSIVVYAGAAGAVLEPTPGNDRGRIIAALENLHAGGSTAGGEGLRLAYSLAEQNFNRNAVNRVTTLRAAGPERIAPEWWFDDPAWRSCLVTNVLRQAGVDSGACRKAT